MIIKICLGSKPFCTLLHKSMLGFKTFYYSMHYTILCHAASIIPHTFSLSLSPLLQSFCLFLLLSLHLSLFLSLTLTLSRSLHLTLSLPLSLSLHLSVSLSLSFSIYLSLPLLLSLSPTLSLSLFSSSLSLSMSPTLTLSLSVSLCFPFLDRCSSQCRTGNFEGIDRIQCELYR